jgi:hypothetical protein
MIHPFVQEQPLYRTAIAVGDYPVDHHHGKNPEAPVIHFPQVNSFSIPIGALIPEKIQSLVVCEKGISVSNLANGSTRLQPCVLLTGQAAGALAALSVQQNKQPAEMQPRDLQTTLLRQNVFLLPYVDVTPTDSFFAAVQRIGATGILRGVGKKEGWANKTFFYPDSICNGHDLTEGVKSFILGIRLPQLSDTVTISDIEIIRKAMAAMGIAVGKPIHTAAIKSRPLLRKEVAWLIDTHCNPFQLPINLSGKWSKETRHLTH